MGRVVAGVLLAGSLAGCTIWSQRSFADSPERIRAAVKAVLGHCPDLQEEGALIRTGTCSRPFLPGMRRSGGRWREWHEVRIVGSTLEIHSSAEESGPYGHGRHRWERRSSQELEEAVLDAIASYLATNR